MLRHQPAALPDDIAVSLTSLNCTFKLTVLFTSGMSSDSTAGFGGVKTRVPWFSPLSPSLGRLTLTWTPPTTTPSIW